MGFDYTRTIFDGITKHLFESSFTINATIQIAGREVLHESIYKGVGDHLDGRVDEPIQQTFPLDMPRFVRVKGFPIDRPYNRHDSISYSSGARFEPFDRWIAFLLSDIAVKNEKTYLDFSSIVSISSVSYTIKGKFQEDFGLVPIVHTFLVKESD